MNKTGVDDKAFSEIKGKGFFICPEIKKRSDFKCQKKRRR